MELLPSIPLVFICLFLVLILIIYILLLTASAGVNNAVECAILCIPWICVMFSHRVCQLLDKDCIFIVSGRLIASAFKHKEVSWKEVLELRKSKLPSKATMESGKNEASKNYLFNTIFPLRSTWLCAVKRVNSSPQLYSQACSQDLAASVLYTQGRGKKRFHYVDCFSLVLSSLSTSTPSVHAASSLPHNSECLLPSQAPSSLSSSSFSICSLIHTGLCRLTPLWIWFLLLLHTEISLQHFSLCSCIIEFWYF